jgi:hypothetical protein
VLSFVNLKTNDMKITDNIETKVALEMVRIYTHDILTGCVIEPTYPLEDRFNELLAEALVNIYAPEKKPGFTRVVSKALHKVFHVPSGDLYDDSKFPLLVLEEGIAYKINKEDIIGVS